MPDNALAWMMNDLHCIVAMAVVAIGGCIALAVDCWREWNVGDMGMTHEEHVIKDALDLQKEPLQPVWKSECLNTKVDMVEVVRCKYCKHHGKDTCGAEAGIAYPPPDEWFCADGERRDGDG